MASPAIPQLNPTPAKRLGRPPKYTPELAAEVLRRIAAGESLSAVCRDKHLPSRAIVNGWVIGERGAPPSFRAAYARAKAARVEVLADEIISLADEARGCDNAEVQACRLQVDARKWSLARMAPKEWGDRVQHDIGGQAGNPVQRMANPLDHLNPAEQAEWLRLTQRAAQRAAQAQLGSGAEMPGDAETEPG